MPIHVVAVTVGVGACRARDPDCGDRCLVEHPHHGLDGVDAGVDVVGAADRHVVDPDQVTQAALDVLRQGWVSKQPTVVEALDDTEVPQRPFPISFGTFKDMWVGRHLVIDQKTLFLLGGLLGGSLDLQAAGDIDGDGLGHIDVQARVHGRLDMLGKEARRGLECDGFDATFDQLAVTGQTGKPSRLVHAECITRGIGDLLEVIGHGVDVITTMFLEEPGDPLPAATTADQRRV